MNTGDIIEWQCSKFPDASVHKWRVVGIHLGGQHKNGRWTESLIEMESITHEPGVTGEFEYHPRLWVPEVLVRHLKITAGATSEPTRPPPYPFCRTPDECAGRGYCPKDIACND